MKIKEQKQIENDKKEQYYNQLANNIVYSLPTEKKI